MYDNIYQTGASASSVVWSAIGNPSANLTLAMAGFTSTFNQTSAISWLWANTTAAVSGTAQSSPLLELSGSSYSGAAAVTDTWTIQDVCANSTTTPGTSELKILHTGTTGSSALDVAKVTYVNGTTGGPFVQGGYGFDGTKVTGSSTPDMICGEGSGIFSFVPSSSTSVNVGTSLRLYSNAATTTNSLTWQILTGQNNTAGNVNFTVQAELNASGSIMSFLCGAGTYAGAPGILFGGNGPNDTIDFSATSGTQVAVAVGNQSGTGSGRVLFDPTSGSASFIASRITPYINNTATGPAISSAVITSATVAAVTIPSTTGFVTGASVTIANVSTAGFTGLNGTWVVAAGSTSTVLNLTTTGLTAKAQAACNGNVSLGAWNPTFGAYSALTINAVETAVIAGVNNRLVDCYAGSAGTTSEFAISNKGVAVVYGAQATVKNGLAPILNTSVLTAQSSAISAHSLVTSTPANGMWRISFVATCTTAGTTGAILGGTTGFQITFVNGNGDSVTKTTSQTVQTSVATSTADTISGDLYCYAGSATAITYSFGYTAGAPTAGAFDIAVYAEFLG